MNKLLKVLESLENVWMFISAGAILLMMVSISADSIGRYLFHHPLPGNYELTSWFSMVVIAFMGLSKTYAQGGHIRMGRLSIIHDHLPYRIADRIYTSLGCLVFLVMAYYAGLDAIEKIVNRESTFGVVQFPIYLSFLWFPLGCLLFGVRLMFDTIWPRRDG